MDKEKFLKRYDNYSEDVKEYMNMFANSLEDKYQEIPDVFIVSLDILAGNLTLMTKSMKAIVSGEAGIVGQDNYRGEKKSIELTAFLSSQSNVNKIVTAFGWTPVGRSKIRDNQDAQDLKEYLKNITEC